MTCCSYLRSHTRQCSCRNKSSPSRQPNASQQRTPSEPGVLTSSQAPCPRSQCQENIKASFLSFGGNYSLGLHGGSPCKAFCSLAVKSSEHASFTRGGEPLKHCLVVPFNLSWFLRPLGYSAVHLCYFRAPDLCTIIPKLFLKTATTFSLQTQECLQVFPPQEMALRK